MRFGAIFLSIKILSKMIFRFSSVFGSIIHRENALFLTDFLGVFVFKIASKYRMHLTENNMENEINCSEPPSIIQKVYVIIIHKNHLHNLAILDFSNFFIIELEFFWTLISEFHPTGRINLRREKR